MKRTYQPKIRKRRRKHGFLHMNRKHKKVLKSRRLKGRVRLTVITPIRH